ncbi:MAG: glycosyltransferase family 2 protein [Cyclobacteriaceae bacterium]|nr:glycosyltransferase family 2 protein [Cyclobacteriaceae bacterium]
MKVCGFTIVRNAVKLDYPVVESIRSILPLCDEVIVAVGKSEDNTLEVIRAIDPEKIRVIETVWDDTQREGGRVLALETNKAFAAVPADADWCFYIQADEVLHEQYLDTVRKAMERYLDDSRVEGLLFNYRHFYGSYDYVGASWKWYRREIRIIRNDRQIFSYRDAQGFRRRPNEKLRVKLMDAEIYHYGWVREPKAMRRKQVAFSQLYHDDQWLQENIPKEEDFDYREIDSLVRFEGSHPKVMEARIRRLNWRFDHDLSKNRISLREKLKRIASFLLLGYRVGEYKNYKLLR